MKVYKNQSQGIKAPLVTSCFKKTTAAANSAAVVKWAFPLGERCSLLEFYLDFFLTCQRLAASAQLISHTAGSRRNVSSMSGVCGLGGAQGHLRRGWEFFLLWPSVLYWL